jgi:hypothetical protein
MRGCISSLLKNAYFMGASFSFRRIIRIAEQPVRRGDFFSSVANITVMQLLKL